MEFDQFLAKVVGIGLIVMGLSTAFLPFVALGVFLLATMPKAEQLATDVIEKSPPGDGCALVGALVTVALPGAVVLIGIFLAVANGSI